MGNYTIFLMFKNPRRSRQARNFTENDPKILDLKSSSEQIIFRKLSLGAPVFTTEVKLIDCTRLYFVESIRKNFVLTDGTGSYCNGGLHSHFTSRSGLRSVLWTLF